MPPPDSMSTDDVNLIQLLEMTKQLGCSDLHLTVGAPPLGRLNGELMPLCNGNLSRERSRELILSALSDRQRAELEENWELDFALQVETVGRLRANAHFNRGTLQGAFRIISDQVPTLAELGHRPVVTQLCELRDGLILVTGVTGSGKSTTLAAMVEYISQRRSGVIVSVEDPIEYIFRHNRSIIKQREVGVDTKSFASALKHVLRQDPDVILVSELRDLETIRTAITAAETGHLVISTLHTIDAPRTLDRLIDVFPGDQQPQVTAQLSNALRAVVSQRLLPRSDKEGRALATETLIMNQAVRACMCQRKFEQIPGLLQIGNKDGMHTLDDSLINLVALGQVDLEEALYHASDPNHVRAQFAHQGKRKR